LLETDSTVSSGNEKEKAADADNNAEAVYSELPLRFVLRKKNYYRRVTWLQ
jgi:hypothetical protein